LASIIAKYYTWLKDDSAQPPVCYAYNQLSKHYERGSGGSEFDQSKLYACMEISQLNPFAKLIYTNKKLK
jgi:hypothetical protein